ncbi:hypothetical protein BA190_08530 [Labrys sp. WJW]|nr:hypothetical protein BA190_08530 [Labrys sp. WJW]
MLWQLLGWAGLIAICLAGWAAGLQFTGNVHQVEPGLYRSAQLSPEKLQEVITSGDIRTIVNLRGPHRGAGWYEDEKRTTQILKVLQIDIPMSSDKAPDPETLARLISVLKTAKQPILVHCKNGADRTGLAAALFEHLVAGKTPEEARQQLSFYYGHFPWLGSGTAAMDETFDRVAASRDR